MSIGILCVRHAQKAARAYCVHLPMYLLHYIALNWISGVPLNQAAFYRWDYPICTWNWKKSYFASRIQQLRYESCFYRIKHQTNFYSIRCMWVRRDFEITEWPLANAFANIPLSSHTSETCTCTLCNFDEKTSLLSFSFIHIHQNHSSELMSTYINAKIYSPSI